MIPISVDQKLVAFVRLPKGWHFGDGEPISLRAITAARRLLVTAYSRDESVESDVFPGLKGEVRVCFYIGTDYHQFTIEPDFSITYQKEENDIEVGETISLNLNASCDKVIAAIPKQCPSFGSSHYSITMSEKNAGSIVWLSDPAPTEQYRSLMKIASLVLKQQAAITFKSFTPNLKTSSLDLKQGNFQTDIV